MTQNLILNLIAKNRVKNDMETKNKGYFVFQNSRNFCDFIDIFLGFFTRFFTSFEKLCLTGHN